MKILVVSQYFYPEEFKVNEMVEEFVKLGHEVTVLSGKPNYPKGEFFKGYKFFGVQHVVVSLIYMAVQLLIAIGQIFLPINHWFYFCIVIVVLIIAYILFMLLSATERYRICRTEQGSRWTERNQSEQLRRCLAGVDLGIGINRVGNRNSV